MMAEPRRRARKHSGELALLAGVGRSTVQALEGGKNTVQLDSVVAVADALGCDIALLTRAGSFVPLLDPT